MLRRLLLAAAVMVAAAPSWAQTVAGSENVPTTHAVFVVLCDDCGTTQDARYGASGAGVSTEMPALDSLSSQGTRMTAFYANPLCAATRSSLVFGQYNFRTGAYGGPAGGWPYGRDSSLGAVAEVASVATYATGKYGGGGSTDFPGWGAMEDGWTAMEVFNDQTPNDYSAWTRTSGTQAQFQALGAPPQSNTNTTAETVFMDTRHVDDAISLYASRDRSKNAVFYVAPHGIHDTASGAYDPTKAPPHTGASCTDGSDTCRERAQTRFAEDFARLLAAIDQTRDYVVLLGDNGQVGGPGCKGALTECGIRVPAYVYGPGVTAAATFGEVVHIVDVWATALDLAGVTSYAGASVVDGYSFADQVVAGHTCGLTGRCWADRSDEIAYVVDNETHSSSGDGDRAVIMETSVGRYKLVVDYTTAGVALFDLSSYNAGTGVEPADICGGDDDCTGISGNSLTAYNEICAVYEAAEPTGADCPTVTAGVACTDGVDCPVDLLGATTGAGDNVLYFVDYQSDAWRNPLHANNPTARVSWRGDSGIQALVGFGTAQDGAWDSGVAGEPTPANGMCVGLDDPWDCCTGLDAGSCPTVGVSCSEGTCQEAVWAMSDAGVEDIYECPVTQTGGGTRPAGESNYCSLAILAPNQTDEATNGAATLPSQPPKSNLRQWFAYRVPIGEASNQSDRAVSRADGNISLGGAIKEVGITRIIAYSDNLLASGVCSSQWKHDELENSSFGGFGEYPDIGCQTGNVFPASDPPYFGDSEAYPFNAFMWANDCATAVSTMSATVGEAITCNFGNGSFTTGPVVGTGAGEYQRSVHWPFGTWACVQTHIITAGAPERTSVTVTLTTATSGGARVVKQHDDFTTSALQNLGTYTNIKRDNNANRNSDAGTATTETTLRHEAGLVVTDGAPATCAEAAGTAWP